MNVTIVNKGNNYRVASIEGAHLIGRPGSLWRKFAGVPTDGGLKHQFTIEVDEEFVDILRSLNLEPKHYEKEGYDPFWYLTISLSWRFRDPEVYTIAYNMVKSKETEQTIGDLDQNSNVQFIDLEVAASHYNSHGREGYTAYGSNVYIYLGAPSLSEQRYLERCGINVEAGQGELPGMPDTDEDVPF